MNEILDDLQEAKPTVYGNRAVKFFWLSLCCLILLSFVGYSGIDSLSVGYLASFITLLIPILFLSFIVIGFVNSIRSIKAKEKLGLFKTITIYGNIFFVLLFAIVIIVNLIDIFTYLN